MASMVQLKELVIAQMALNQAKTNVKVASKLGVNMASSEAALERAEETLDHLLAAADMSRDDWAVELDALVAKFATC